MNEHLPAAPRSTLSPGDRIREGSRSPIVEFVERCTSGLPAPLRALLPVVVPVIAPKVATAIYAASIAGEAVGAALTHDSERKVDGIARAVVRVRRQVSAARRELTEAQVDALIVRPDFLRFAAEAEDLWALEQYRSRLDRFADLLSGRLVEQDAAAPLDEDLLLARAALELQDVVVELLQVLETAPLRRVTRESRVEYGAPPEARVLFVAEILTANQRTWPDAASVIVAARGLARAETLGLVCASGIRWDHSAMIRCKDGEDAMVENTEYGLTGIGRRFLAEIRAARGRGGSAAE